MANVLPGGVNWERTKARQLKKHRAAVLLQLFTPPPLPGIPDANTPILNDIANSFSRFAAYQQTAFDSGAGRSSSSNDASTMSKLVQSAIHRVLGGGTAGGSSFIAALNSTFPSTITSDGPQVISTPSRSMVALYQSGGSGNGSGTVTTNSYAGTISARQANLYREASVLVNDGLRLLAGLTPFVPEAELDQVEALRVLIRSELNALVEEFGRVDEPRAGRVQAYFSALKLNLNEFGRRSFLDNSVQPATVDDEAQIAGFTLLQNYASTLSQAWNTYYQFDTLSGTSFSLSERVERANILLPVVAQANNDFEAAMDSVNFTETDRRSMAARFDTLAGIVPVTLLPEPLLDMTVYDLTDWIDRYSTEGLGILADSGQYGLNFVTDQADSLFWAVAPVVAAIQYTEQHFGTSANSLMLEQVLSNERVLFALNNLLSQLNSLADLSVFGGRENLLTV